MKIQMKIQCNYTGLFFLLALISFSTIGQKTIAATLVSQPDREINDEALEKKLEVKSNAVTFGELLPGKAGVYVQQNGVIGNAPLLMVRGINTINLNATPYVFIDGVPMKYARSLPSGGRFQRVGHSGLAHEKEKGRLFFRHHFPGNRPRLPVPLSF